MTKFSKAFGFGLFLSSVTICASIAFACGEEGNDGAPDVTATSSPVVAPALLEEVLDLDLPGQITYRWTGEVPGGGSGIVIYRADGTLRRWDAVVGESGLKDEGSFTVYRFREGSTESFGCIWLAVQEQEGLVRADCVEGGPAPTMEGILLLGLLTNQIQSEIEGREVLGREIRCFESVGIEEICVDEDGRVLYLDNGSEQFEATFALDQYEPFDWPFAEAGEFTPTTLEETQSVIALDLPSEFVGPQ